MVCAETPTNLGFSVYFFFQAEDGIRDIGVTGVQTCALPIFYLQSPGTRHHLDFPALCDRKVWVYGQTEVTKDLIKAQLDGGPPLLFEVSDVQPEDVDGDSPRIRFTDEIGRAHV